MDLHNTIVLIICIIVGVKLSQIDYFKLVRKPLKVLISKISSLGEKIDDEDLT